MTTYTKRQYQADIAANETAVAANNETIARLEADYTPAHYDALNAAYDLSHNLEVDLSDIHRRFRQRNWTQQDRAFANLVAANID